MLKQTITYEDFNGKERTEDYYFNLTKTELTRLQAHYHTANSKGLEDYLNTIVENDDQEKIVDFFEDLIKRSYGVKSEDGKHFRKNEEIITDFFDSPAYDSLFIKVCSDTDAAVAFVSGLIPKDLAEEVKKQQAQQA